MLHLKYKRELEYYAALMRFDGLNAEIVKAIQKIIDALMNEGVFYDEFLEIVHPTSNLTEDFMPAFEAALKSLNCNIPKDHEQALWLVLKHHISHIVSGAVDPLDEVKQIIDVYDVYGHYLSHTKSKEVAGDSHGNQWDSYGIEHLIGLYWAYDDMMEYEEEAIAEVKKEILQSAQQWLEKNG